MSFNLKIENFRRWLNELIYAAQRYNYFLQAQKDHNLALAAAYEATQSDKDTIDNGPVFVESAIAASENEKEVDAWGERLLANIFALSQYLLLAIDQEVRDGKMSQEEGAVLKQAVVNASQPRALLERAQQYYINPNALKADQARILPAFIPPAQKLTQRLVEREKELMALAIYNSFATLMSDEARRYESSRSVYLTGRIANIFASDTVQDHCSDLAGSLVQASSYRPCNGWSPTFWDAVATDHKRSRVAPSMRYIDDEDEKYSFNS